MKTTIEFVEQFTTIKIALRAIDEIIIALENHEWQNKEIIMEYKKLQNDIIKLEI